MYATTSGQHQNGIGAGIQEVDTATKTPGRRRHRHHDNGEPPPPAGARKSSLKYGRLKRLTPEQCRSLEGDVEDADQSPHPSTTVPSPPAVMISSLPPTYQSAVVLMPDEVRPTSTLLTPRSTGAPDTGSTTSYGSVDMRTNGTTIYAEQLPSRVSKCI